MEIIEEMLPKFPKSFTASTRYGTLELWQSGNGSATQQTYFVSVDDVAVYITIKLIGLADEQYDGETTYDCEFTENYYNYETGQEEEWDNGSCTLTVMDSGFSEIEDIGYSITGGIDAVIGKSAKKSKGDNMAKRMNKKALKEQETEIEDDDVVEIEEEDGQKKVEIESKEEHEKEVEDGEESESDNLNEFVKGKKSKKSSVKKYGGDFKDGWDTAIAVVQSANAMSYGELKATDKATKEITNSSFGFVELLETIFNRADEILDEDEGYEASTKKSRMAKLHKKLNKIGGFTKEDEDEGVSGRTVGDVVDSSKHPGSQRNNLSSIFDDEEDEIIDEEERMTESCKGCKGKKSRKSRKMKKEELDYDADDQQEINEKGSGSAGSELPEDADEQQEINEKGSGSAGKELPEDADEQQDIKESRRKSSRKNVNKSVRPVRKFSVTNGGSPSQDSYLHRYQQSPMVRNAIDGRSNVEKFDEVGMLQQRLNEMNKSKRNARNNVPMRLR